MRTPIGVLGLLLGALAAAGHAQADPLRLDHVVLVVSNLEQAQAELIPLGFRFKPGRRHANNLLNRHIRFRDSTELELMTLTGPPLDASARDYARLLRKGPGGAYVACSIGPARALARREPCPMAGLGAGGNSAERAWCSSPRRLRPLPRGPSGSGSRRPLRHAAGRTSSSAASGSRSAGARTLMADNRTRCSLGGGPARLRRRTAIRSLSAGVHLFRHRRLPYSS